MNKTLMIQLSLLGLSLIAMLIGIMLQKPIVAEQDPKLQLMIDIHGDLVSTDEMLNEDGQRLIIDSGSESNLNTTETVF